MNLGDVDTEDLTRFDVAMIASGRQARFSFTGGHVWKPGDPPGDAVLLLAGSAALVANTPLGTFELAKLKAPCILGLAELLLIGNKRLSGLDLSGRAAFVSLTAEEARPAVLLETPGGASFRRLTLSSFAQAIRLTNEGLKRFFDESPAQVRDRYAQLKFEELIAEAAENPYAIDKAAPAAVPLLPAPPIPFEERPQDSKPQEAVADWNEANSIFQLAGLDPQLFPKLGMTVRDYAAGSNLAKAGDAGEEAFLVLSGKVRVSRNIAGQGEEAYAVVGPGQFLGEMALIDDAPRSADLIAHQERVRVAVLKREIFRKLVVFAPAGSATLVGGLIVCLARRLREAIQRHVSLYVMAGGFANQPAQQLPPL